MSNTPYINSEFKCIGHLYLGKGQVLIQSAHDGSLKPLFGGPDCPHSDGVARRVADVLLGEPMVRMPDNVLDALATQYDVGNTT